MQLRSIFRRIRRRYPVIGSLDRRIYYLVKPLNRITKSIRGKQNVIRYGDNSILYNVHFDIKGDRNRIEIQDDCLLNSVTFLIRGNDHRIEIGSRCKFNRGGLLWLEDERCSLLIGAGSTFEDVHIAVTEPDSRVEIGEDCMFAYDIDVRTGDSHSILDSVSRERINFAENIRIGNHVWVGPHSTLLKGVSLADNSVVATGSIVTTSFAEEGVIIAGNPARIVRQQINWSRKRIYKSG